MNATERLAAALSGRYRLERELGAGGMATVYLAHDLKHERPVAIKVLHPELGAVIGADRFLAEIRTTANLQHPNILPLFDSGTAGGFVFYVMPFVEGETLRDRLLREQQLAIDEAVRIATGVGNALEYAHRHGVIHRDIKPENILLQDGQALVADFGIALAVTNAGGTRITQTGISVGTPAYMSPEQAAAERELDGRSDVYSLGAVVFEMLAGEAPFTGPNTPAILVKLMSEPAPLVTTRRRSVPVHLAAAVAKCLEKVPADRFRSAAEFVQALTSPRALSDGALARVVRGAPVPSWRERLFAPLGVLALVASLVSGTLWLTRPRGGDRQVLHLPLALESPYRARNPWAVSAQLAPNGRTLVYDGPDGRVMHDLATGKARDVPNATGLSMAFSPSSDSLAVRTRGYMGQVWVVSLATGQRQMVADSALNYSMSWGDDGWIYMGGTSGNLERARPDGSARETLVALDTGGYKLNGGISAIPGGRGVIYGRGKWAAMHASETELFVLDLASRRSTLLGRGVQALTFRPGYLAVVQSDGRVVAARFDLDRLTPKGNFIEVGDSVEVYDGFQQRASVSVSSAGDLLYVMQAPFTEDSIVVVGRDGRVMSRIGDLRGWVNGLRLSPDEETLVLSVSKQLGGPPNLWAMPATGGPQRRVSFGQILDQSARFMNGGREVAFVGPRAGRNWDLYRAPLTGDRDATLMLDRRGDIASFSLTPDDRWVVYCERDNVGNQDVRAHRLDPDSLTVDVAATPASECAPALSGDGRWLAYESNESGRPEVYVRPFPVTSDSRWQVTTSGGTTPRWGRSGSELFFLTGDGHVAALPVNTKGAFSFGAPKALFPVRSLTWSGEIARDDQHFFMLRPNLRAPGQVVLVRNWVLEVERSLAAAEPGGSR